MKARPTGNAEAARPNPKLYEFIADHRGEILERCVDRLQVTSPEEPRDELAADLHVVIDEIVRALAEDAGLSVSSPLPGWSPTAAAHGGRRQRSGYPIERLALDFGLISDTVGELGSERGLKFESREYQVFDQCVDAAIAAALERYASEAREKENERTAERLGRLAHELRNSLASARMAFAVLRQGRVTVQSRTGAVLDRSLGRLEALVDQTLLAVQLEIGRKPTATRMRVADLLAEVEAAAVPERGIQARVEVDDDLQVDADERLLVTALSNLVQNAFKFTRAGGRIVMRARREADAIVIEVEDECGGLPPGKESELFAPFVQRGSDSRGLGLGLSIAREAVEVQGGVLVARNLPGCGCIFSVRLPTTTG